MNQIPATDQKNIPLRAILESKIKHWIKRTKALNGEPRYVAMGMAIGIFVSATPTIPFQTLIAVALSFIMRGSKAAAAAGVWLSNPITFPVFYLASYKTGTLLFGISSSHDFSSYTMSNLLKLGFDITAAAIAGGFFIGIFLAIGAYFITHRIVTKIRSREKRLQVSLPRRRKTETGRQRPEDRGQRAENRRKLAPALVTAPADPACKFSTSILCQPVTKDQRPGN